MRMQLMTSLGGTVAVWSANVHLIFAFYSAMCTTTLMPFKLETDPMVSSPPFTESYVFIDNVRPDLALSCLHLTDPLAGNIDARAVVLQNHPDPFFL
jgi:hypothetical protein